MRKQHYTAEIPVSNPYNIAAFEDLVSKRDTTKKND